MKHLICAALFVCGNLGFTFAVTAQAPAQAKPLPRLNSEEAYYDRAMERLESGDNAGAIDDLSQALKLDPKSARAIGMRAYTYLLTGDYPRSIADTDYAIRLDPNNAQAYQVRGRVMFAQGKLTEAIADLDKSVAAFPTHDFSYYYRGLVYTKAGELDKAIADFDKALELAPEKHGMYYDGRGKAYFKKGDFDKAAADFDAQIVAEPTVAGAYYNRGEVEFVQKRFAEAKVYCDLAINLYPKYVEAYILRAESQISANPEQAIKDLEMAAELDSSRPEAYTVRALIYNSQGDSQRTDAVLDEMLRKVPDSNRALMERGKFFAQIESYDKAIADFTELRKRVPDDMSVLRSRAVAHHANFDYEEAVADFTELMRLDPAFPEAQFRRGIEYLNLVKDEEALADFNATIERDPKHGEAYCFRGSLYFLFKKDNDKAMADFNSAIANNQAAYLERGDVYYAQKEYAKAIDDYNEAIRQKPDAPEGYRELAWALATCPDEKLRDGAKALELATKAATLTKVALSTYYTTLAAASAETGDFPKAIEMQEQALKVSLSEKSQKEAQARLDLYKQMKPIRGEMQPDPAAYYWYTGGPYF